MSKNIFHEIGVNFFPALLYISQASAFYQVARIAKAQKIPTTEIEKIIYQNTENPTCGFLG